MFTRNEMVVYPGHGVAVINCIVEKTIAGKITQFFELRFLNKDMTILVPTKNALDVGMRPLSSSDHINTIFAVLQKPYVTKHTEVVSNWNKRNKAYQGTLRTGNLQEICAIYRDLKHIEKYKELSFGEKNLLQQTELLLAEEISVVKKIEITHATEQLRMFVGPQQALYRETTTTL